MEDVDSAPRSLDQWRCSLPDRWRPLVRSARLTLRSVPLPPQDAAARSLKQLRNFRFTPKVKWLGIN